MDKLADRIERLCGHPYAFVVFSLVFLAGIFLVGVDITNVAVSYFTTALLLLLLGGQRRDRKAVHAKLDDLEISSEQANSDMARIEELTEEEIEAKRR